ncbi:glycosyltransferase [Streptomyces sp. NPDC017673]|uniref:glycosyltransferase n=1 Tax=unclassified Streptomyces TaxID=2593676 RepID=UPI003796F03A
MAKVIVASTPLHGHVTPMLAVAQGLVRRGHEVRFLTSTRYADRVRAAGAAFVPLPGQADYDDRALDVQFPGRAAAQGPGRLIFDIKNLFGDAIPDQFSALRSLLAEFPASTVISDLLFFGALPLSLGTPRSDRPTTVTMGISPVPVDSVDTAPFGFGVPPLPGAEGRARNEAMYAQAREVFADAEGHVGKVLAGLGVTLSRSLFSESAAAADHFLQLTVPGFEYPRSDAPASLRFVGALPSEPGTDAELPEWWDDLVQGNGPVVTVTQGTVDNADFSPLLLPTLRALADLDVTVVAATARPGGPEAVRAALGELPANVLLGGYIPFDRLLPLSDVLVTNGGYGGVHTALRHGVPLVVAGTTEDKPEVAARVEWAGAGVNLRTDAPDEETLRTAVGTVLNEPNFRSQARALQAEMAQYDPFAAIAEVVERAEQA